MNKVTNKVPQKYSVRNDTERKQLMKIADMYEIAKNLQRCAFLRKLLR